MKKPFASPLSENDDVFRQAVFEAIASAEAGELIDHRQVQSLFLKLKIKTLRLMDCKRKRNWCGHRWL